MQIFYNVTEVLCAASDLCKGHNTAIVHINQCTLQSVHIIKATVKIVDTIKKNPHFTTILF